jgi:hypothetical protein
MQPEEALLPTYSGLNLKILKAFHKKKLFKIFVYSIVCKQSKIPKCCCDESVRMKYYSD